MNCKISSENINSFVGNVLPLWLVCDEDISKEPIKWQTSDSDTVGIHTFEGNDPQSITHGALLTLKKCGVAKVTAELDGVNYSCQVSVREMKRPSKDARLNYYIGDFHDHTSTTHNHEKFANRETDFPIDYINRIKNERLIDFSVISDHASVTNPRDFFRGFTDTELAQPMDAVILPGSESEVTVIEEDRFGIPYKNSGEIVSVNASNFKATRSWQEFYDVMSDSPFAVCIFAHPYVLGISTPGCWNFKFKKNNTPEMKALMKGIEMGNGNVGQSLFLFEAAYSLALDSGFRISCTCSSDSHGPIWGFNACPGKTVIMAEERSKEAFLAALLDRRFYATESGNVGLYYTVNGSPAASDLDPAATYKFHVELFPFRDEPDTAPVQCKLISDGGKTVKVVDCKNLSEFDFDVESDSASYFYLRLMDAEGRKTWSAPVWTGRTHSPLPDTDNVIPIDKTGFTVTEAESGLDASVLVNGDIREEWHSELKKASYVIDMQEEKTVSAFGYYTPYIIYKPFKRAELSVAHIVGGFTSEYRISTSPDGVNYIPCAEGAIREYSGEEIIPFERHRARYVKFEVLTTAGQNSGRSERMDDKIVLAELSLFE